MLVTVFNCKTYYSMVLMELKYWKNLLCRTDRENEIYALYWRDKICSRLNGGLGNFSWRRYNKLFDMSDRASQQQRHLI